jgi:phage FluMu protein Com
METVQLQCGQCKKLIAIRVEHMGAQVQCPHCRSVVQTPPRAAAPAPLPPPPMPAVPNMDLHQPESIFAGAESSDSLMGDAPAPQVEMPTAPAAPDSSPSASDTAPAPSVETDFSQFKKKPTFDKSVIPLLMLIFLVPYALLTTAFIAYLLLTQGRSGHPFDYLPDSAPGKDKGAPRKVRAQPIPNQPLADHQRTTIGKAIKAGDLLLTPQRVVLTAEGDLKLILRAKNISTNTKFEPVNGYFLRPTKGGAEPYAFLESKTGSVAIINAADLGYHANPKATDEARGDALLAPGAEITIALTTDLKFRAKHIPNIAKAAEESYTWRVQVRRGFVKVNDKDVSATTVIGVDFTNAEIEHEKS